MTAQSTTGLEQTSKQQLRRWIQVGVRTILLLSVCAAAGAWIIARQSPNTRARRWPARRNGQRRTSLLAQAAA